MLYRISYFDARDGLRKYYMRTAFETVDLAKQEMDRISYEMILSKKWYYRREWAISTYDRVTKKSEFVEYYDVPAKKRNKV